MTDSPLDTYLAETARPWPYTALHAIITAVRASADLDEAIKWDQPYFSMNEHAVLKLYAARE